MLFPGLDNRHLIAPGHFKEYVGNRQCNSWMLTYIHLLGCPVDTERYTSSKMFKAVLPPHPCDVLGLWAERMGWTASGTFNEFIEGYRRKSSAGTLVMTCLWGRNSHFTSLHISPKARLRPNQALPKKRICFFRPSLVTQMRSMSCGLGRGAFNGICLAALGISMEHQATHTSHA